MKATRAADVVPRALSDGRRSLVEQVAAATDARDRDGSSAWIKTRIERLVGLTPLEDPEWLQAHELGTAVTAILGFIDLLDTKGLMDNPETLRAFLVRVRGQAAEFASVVSELVCVECADSAPPPRRRPSH